jgi:hypothetical protein
MPMSGLQPFIELSSKRDKWMWIYKGTPLDEKVVDNWEAFVYIITCPDGLKYIGKKTFWFMRKKPKATRRSKTESDWKKYYGSNEYLKEETKKSTEGYTREILHLCKTKGEATYLEVKEQFTRNVLEDESYLNDNISGKFFRGRVKTWKERNDG